MGEAEREEEGRQESWTNGENAWPAWLLYNILTYAITLLQKRMNGVSSHVSCFFVLHDMILQA
jgi:hypothetical protein